MKVSTANRGRLLAAIEEGANVAVAAADNARVPMHVFHHPIINSFCFIESRRCSACGLTGRLNNVALEFGEGGAREVEGEVFRIPRLLHRIRRKFGLPEMKWLLKYWKRTKTKDINKDSELGKGRSWNSGDGVP